MVILDFSGDFLKLESTKDGDIAIILDECKEEYNDTLKKNIKNMQVELNGKEKTYSPNNSAGQALQGAYGDDSKLWIGQKFTILHIDKKMVIRPLKLDKV